MKASDITFKRIKLSFDTCRHSYAGAVINDLVIYYRTATLHICIKLLGFILRYENITLYNIKGRFFFGSVSDKY